MLFPLLSLLKYGCYNIRWRMMLFWGKKWEEVHILSFFTLFDTDTKLCINPKILKNTVSWFSKPQSMLAHRKYLFTHLRFVHCLVYVPKIFFLKFSLMPKVPLISLNAKTSSMERYFPVLVVFPLSTCLPLFKEFIMFIAWETESSQVLNAGNSFICHKLTNSCSDSCRN